MTFSPSWRTSTVVALARQIRESRDYGILPILADALQDAGCDDPTLAALRDEGIASSASGLWLAGCLGVRQSDPCPCPVCDETGADARAGNRGSLCRVCGGSGSLIWQRHAMSMGGYSIVQRNIYLSFGPLPVVTARVEEIARAMNEFDREKCPQCRGRGGWSGGTVREPWRRCERCEGKGQIVTRERRTWVPSEWLRSLPEWFDVTLEGVEPQVLGHTDDTRSLHGWYELEESHNGIGEIPSWLWNMLEGFRDGWEGRLYPSPTAARLELCRAIRRWRFTS